MPPTAYVLTDSLLVRPMLGDMPAIVSPTVTFDAAARKARAAPPTSGMRIAWRRSQSSWTRYNETTATGDHRRQVHGTRCLFWTIELSDAAVSGSGSAAALDRGPGLAAEAAHPSVGILRPGTRGP